ncbi:hypothetical protein PPYR_10129 [Photinus pyralis]|uniref:Uncharacterized protein n=1 Tax=Photinus pyralis TaxID=7054 RepID=A0A5N4AFR0_PHOPY|nr:uncharacterized protein LOC116175122 [Photinus pyralis]KAB0796068.1 hypothetical protein PPYR_10129 [Photinus pyralis]
MSPLSVLLCALVALSPLGSSNGWDFPKGHYGSWRERLASDKEKKGDDWRPQHFTPRSDLLHHEASLHDWVEKHLKPLAAKHGPFFRRPQHHENEAPPHGMVRPSVGDEPIPESVKKDVLDRLKEIEKMLIAELSTGHQTPAVAEVVVNTEKNDHSPPPPTEKPATKKPTEKPKDVTTEKATTPPKSKTTTDS